MLEDLRVLEQQQREAQRKLANARMTKEARIQKHATLESNLELLKYSNGELRAQLRQSRDILSIGTRELGTRRLAARSAGNSIQAFEQKLKQGLRSARVITAYRRKIDSIIITIENKETTLVRLTAEGKKKVNELQKDHQKMQHHEETLRASIRQELSKVQSLAESVASLRTNNNALEQEMVEAQNMEESTKLREEAIAAQITAEQKRHQAATAKLAEQIEVYEERQGALSSQVETFKIEVEAKKQKLVNAEQQIILYQQSEGHELSPLPGDPQAPVPILDTNRLNAALQADTKAVTVREAENGDLRRLIEQLQVDLEKTEEESLEVKGKASSLSESALKRKKFEEERREVISSFQKELERDREEVLKLEESLQDLRNSRIREALEHSRLIAECNETITQNQEAIEQSKGKIEVEAAVIDKNNTSWAEAKDEICCRLEEAKGRSKVAERELDGLTDKLNQIHAKSESYFLEKIRQIEDEKESHAKESESHVSHLFQSKLH